VDICVQDELGRGQHFPHLLQQEEDGKGEVGGRRVWRKEAAASVPLGGQVPWSSAAAVSPVEDKISCVL
jgi:hypothetical protein